MQRNELKTTRIMESVHKQQQHQTNMLDSHILCKTFRFFTRSMPEENLQRIFSQFPFQLCIEYHKSIMYACSRCYCGCRCFFRHCFCCAHQNAKRKCLQPAYNALGNAQLIEMAWAVILRRLRATRVY